MKLNSIKFASDSYILWIGGSFNEITILHNKAVSHAASRWQKGFILALQNLGEHVEILGHLPEPLWPKGQWRVKGGRDLIASEITGEIVDYLNIPLVRGSSLTNHYLKVFKRLCDNQGLPKIVVTYNVHPHTVALGLYAQNQFGIPWICIVADAPESRRLQKKHEQMIKQASGRIFLSWNSYKTCKHAPVLHLDGGIEQPRFEVNTTADECSIGKPHAIMYSGVMNQYGGVNLLLESFKFIKDQQIQLWLCGKGNNVEVKRAVAQDSRIKWFGVVSEEDLKKMSKTASLFVNPRPSYLPASAGNFPSKVLEYLSYGKPVVSTWTEGLSPDYLEILTVLKNETPLCLAQTIEDVLAWDMEKRLEKKRQILSFLNSKKLWTNQATRLINWLLEEVILSKKS